MVGTNTLSPPQQVAEYYRGRIDRGTIPDGALIPSRRDIAKRWGCSLGSVQRAFATLAAEGRVHVKAHRHGGTYAVGPASRAADAA